jgi:hypothetical protein
MNRYSNIPLLKNNTGTRYYANAKYPDIPFRDSDIYVISQKGDRYDSLAYHYYKDSTLWWIIPAANPRFKPNSLFPILGQQIRIPTDIANIISAYNLLNK